MMPVYFIPAVWLALAAAFAALESLNLSQVNLRYAIAAAAAFAVSIFTPLVAVQLAVFALTAVLLIPVLHRRRDAQRFVGRSAQVVVAVCPGMPGRVRVGGCILRAECGVELPAGTTAVVERLNGDALVVTPARQRRRPLKAAA